jgi:tetratricopeptide (TPR) repeat protein
MGNLSRNRSVIQKLESLLEKPVSQEAEIDTFAALAWELRISHPERSAEYAYEVIQRPQSGVFQASPYKAGLAAGLVALAFIHLQVGELHKATEKCLRALKHLGNAPHSKTTLHIWLVLAQDSFFLGDYLSAKQQSQKAIELAEVFELSIEKAWALDMLATAYGMLGEAANALEFHKKSLDIFEKEDDIDGILRAGNNIAMTLYLQKELEDADAQIKKTLALAHERGNKFDLLNIYCTAAQIAIDLQEFDEAEKNLLAAFSNAEVLENTRTYHIFVLMEWARLFIQQKEHRKAQYNFLQSLVLAEENGQLAEQAHCYHELSSIYAEEGDTERSEKYLEIEASLRNELEELHAKHRKEIQKAVTQIN